MTYMLKVGDKILVDSSIVGYVAKLEGGEVSHIEREDGDGWERNTAIPIDYTSVTSNTYWAVRACRMELLESNNKSKNTMRVKLSIIAKKLLDGNTKTLVKAGFLDEQLNVTDLGNENLTSICFEASKEALVVLAEEAIKEAKEAKK